MRSARLSLALALAALALSSSPAAARQADNAVTRLLEKMDVMPPRHYRGLTVFPLRLRGTEDGTDYASLEQAFRGGFLRVTDTGSVERVTMENTSRHRWIFAMAGEVILGGKQNRMLREDVLLPPDSRPYTVPTYCVEKERWTGHKKAPFQGGRGIGNYALREKALRGAPQADVWGQVQEEQRRFSVEAPTQDFNTVMEAPRVSRSLAEYRRAFKPIWRPRIVGLVAARGRRIVAADAFSNPRLFNKLRGKLIDSYAFDCIGRKWPGQPSQADARDFMARIYTARFRRGSTPAAGRSLEFTGRTSGSALLRGDAVVHLHATGGVRIQPPPPPEPGPPIPIPRPRRQE